MTDLNAPVLEATPVLEASVPVLEATPAPAPAAEEVDLNFTIEHDDLDAPIAGNIQNLPAKVRVALLKTAIRSYVHNRVSTAAAKVKKDNEAWVLHEEALKIDPLNPTVPQPEKPKSVLATTEVINAALKALYEGNMGKKGTGEAKPKKLADPLEMAITRAVVSALYKKRRLTDPAIKYPTVQKEVGNNGRAYLENLVQELVAQGANEAEQRAKVQERYIRPAELLCGINLPKKMAEAGDLL